MNRDKRTKEDYENAAKNSESISNMCKILGLKPKGGNYKTIMIRLKNII